MVSSMFKVVDQHCTSARGHTPSTTFNGSLSEGVEVVALMVVSKHRRPLFSLHSKH